ncbi:MAG TPA: GspH/FimT family pseudopilin [Motiliproteus sp.]
MLALLCVIHLDFMGILQLFQGFEMESKALHRLASKGQRRTHGFTLIELLVVLAIVSIIVVFASPNYSRVMIDSRLDQERLTFATGLAFARSEAVERSSTIRICKGAVTSDPCGNTLVNTFSWNSGFRIVDGSSGEVLRVVKKDDQQVHITYSCGDYLEYGPTGERASPSGGGECKLLLADADDNTITKALVINATGRVRLE